jgi:hypothetical protein
VAITQYAMVMVFGALVAGAGLVLLVVRNEHAENKIKLFGQEFQISTPALVVFLVGCGIFITPVLAPTHDQLLFSVVFPWQKESTSQLLPGTKPVTGGEEQEPNDQITVPNLIQLGSTIRGVIATDQDRDFFKFKTSSQGFKTRVILRKTLPGGFNAQASVYDDAEKKIDRGYALGEDAVSFNFESNANSYYYVMIESMDNSRGPYELLVKQE